MHMISPGKCLVVYGKAWFERDPALRLEVLRECCTEDIVFADDDGRYEGLQAVSDMIGRAMDNMAAGDGREIGSTTTEHGRSAGSVSVEVTTQLERMQTFFRYGFVWIVGGVRHPGGMDFGEFGPDGRMRLITVWNSTDDFPVH